MSYGLLHLLREATFDTAGGPLRVWALRRAASVKAVAQDAEWKEAMVELVIPPLADEPLISDVLTDKLEIASESPGKGLWGSSGATHENEAKRAKASLIIKKHATTLRRCLSEPKWTCIAVDEGYTSLLDTEVSISSNPASSTPACLPDIRSYLTATSPSA